MTISTPPALDRALGRRDLTAFAVNRVIGAGIFGLPALLHAGVGPASIVAMLLAGLVVLGITLCMAEVGSSFSATGGPYLYAHETFGPVVGFEIGWLMWVTQLGGFASVTNLFVNYLGWFFPGVTAGLPRIAIIVTVLAFLTAVNILGVRRAATLNNVLTAGKMIPLALFVVVGLFHVDGALLVPTTVPTAAALSGAVLLAIYAFTGFEVLGVPGGEVRDPARTIPFALLTGLAIVSVVYLGVQAVAVGTLPDLGSSARPLADAAERAFGRAGALVMVTGALVSTLGVAHAILLAAGRMPFAMAERGQLPAAIAAVHPRYRSPYIGILVSAAGMLLFTIVTTFASAVTITVGLRVLIYIVTCAALPVLRRRGGHAPASFRAPAGSVLAVVCVVICAGLLASRPWADIIQLAATVALGLLVWAGFTRVARRKVRQPLPTLTMEVSVGRSLLGVLAGAVVAIVVIMIVETVGMWLYPLPAGVDPTDPATLAAAIPSLPLGAFLFVLASWVLGAALGAIVAPRVARSPARWPGLAVGCLVLLGAAYNIMVIPHPTWFVGAAVVGIVAATLLATARRARAAGGPS